jgi:tRNA dimethylallyltransferase
MNSQNASNKNPLYPVIVISGPTASGKTSLSMNLARLINAEIVSADSRQIYKGMDIGTAKPTAWEMQEIKHHFIDIIAPGEQFSAGEYGKAAREKITALRQQNKNVVVAGGSGLYIRALLYGFISVQNKNELIRKKLNNRLQKEGLEILYRELCAVDADLADRLSPNDTQRILRGLEVFLISGEKLSELQKMEETAAPFKYIQFGLQLNRAVLYERINLRVLKMINDGLIDEVKKLVEIGYAQTNALNAVGYKEVIQFLNGEISKEQMIDIIARNSRRYAKRQLTWFKKDRSIIWLAAEDETNEAKILKQIRI